MRIGFLTTKINFEGAGGSVPDLDCKVRLLRKAGHEVYVLTLFSEKNDYSDLPYPVYERRLRGKKSWLAVQRQVFAALRAYHQRTDAFHVEFHFLYGAALYRLFSGKPVVVFYNREMAAWESGTGVRARIRRTVEKILCRTLGLVADQHYFTTPFLAKMYADFGLRLHKNQSSVIVDFFDPEEMRKSVSGTMREEDSSTIVLFASGRHVEQKGFHLLVKAVAMIPKETLRHVQVIIGGDGPERERTMQLAKERGIEKLISFPGWMTKEAFSERLAHSDIFVLPRWRIEQPSVVVEEALSLGIPVVAPGGGGVEWMARGAMEPFADGDIHSLSSALERLISSKEARVKLAALAQKRWEELDPSARTKELEVVFQKAASRV